jgi:D-psicose/D-tagatose/L-ribulose 3-epimerase
MTARIHAMRTRRLLPVPLIALLLVAPASGQPAAVEVGYCSSLKNLDAARAAGFDYVELGTTEIAGLADEDFEKTLERLKELGFSVPVTNQFVPPSIRLTGSDVQPDAQLTYVRRAFARLARLGTRVVVFGSGGARRVPEGFAKERAFEQLVDFGRRAAAEAKARGITIAIEPLRRQESNIINSAAEGLDLVRAVGHPNFQLMIDFFHLATEQEDPAVILRAKDHLRHLHVANPRGRVFPLRREEFDYAPFFANLKAISYAGRISVEAGSQDVAGEGRQAVALLRRAFER